MASTINADTTSGVIITSDTSGEIKLQSASTDIATVSSTGITMASGKTITGNLIPATAPAFSAYASALTSMTATAWTKIQINTEEYDTNSNFDTLNYRFTPTVAGYYYLSGVWIAASAFCFGMASIYKNGSRYRDGASHGYSTNNSNGFAASGLVYANGSTDYFEFYGQSNVTNNATSGVSATNFSGILIQQA